MRKSRDCRAPGAAARSGGARRQAHGLAVLAVAHDLAGDRRLATQHPAQLADDAAATAVVQMHVLARQRRAAAVRATLAVGLEHAETALNLVGLGDRMHHLPRQLSGGQEQRVAIARAIVTDPDLILADEPTGNLDASSAQDVLTLLSRLNKEFGKTIVMVTHDPHAAHFATKARHLEKGELLPEGQVPADWTIPAKA